MEYEFEDAPFPAIMWETPRTPGLHLSDIIDDLLNKSGLGYKGKGFTDMELTAEMGLLWERVLSLVAAQKYANNPLGEIEKDGVLMTPDGIGPDPKGEVPMVLEEYKITWKSNKSHPNEIIRHMMQVKSYCWAIDTNVCVMKTMYIMGDYRGSGPTYRQSRITFTKRELVENWDILISHAKKEGML